MREPALVARAAAAVADGEHVSWPDVQRLARTPDERALLSQLRDISTLSAPAGRTLEEPPPARSVGATLLLLLAASQVLLAVWVFAAGAGPSAWRFRPAQAFLLLSFGAAALILEAGGRRDVRSRWLMAVYLLSGAAFAHPFLASVAGAVPLAAALRGFALDAFIPYALWRFAQVFPRTERFTWVDRAAAAGARCALVVAVLLAGANVFMFWSETWAQGQLALLAREHPGRLYWNLFYPLALGALAVPALRTWRAGAAERKRVLWFVLPFAAGALPFLIRGLLALLGPGSLVAWMEHGVPARVIDAVVLGALCAIPPATTYAVVARQVLPIRVVFHRATHYLLARASVALLALLPAAALGRFVYLQRDRPLSELLGGGQGALLVGWLALALVLVVARPKFAAFVDRRFGHSRASGHRALAASVAAVRQANGAGDVAATVAREIERMFSAPAGVLQWHAHGADPLHGDLPPLAPGSAVLAIAREVRTPSVLGARSDACSLLPPGDRAWVAATRTDLVLPLHRADGEPVALVAVRGKPSGLGWSGDELALLEALGHAAGLALDQALRASPGAVGDAAPWPVECTTCGCVGAAAPISCGCGGAVQPSLLPAVLHAKFAIEQRIGAGGMGVVYRGRDLALGRSVALKTLPRVEPGAAMRMDREARAMAALIHPHLALIFGAELWHRTPVLVMEFLEGGTLAERLRAGPLPHAEAAALAGVLAGAAGALHEAGLLHGDIKPSNIGFTGTGTPKLLDFGLTRLVAGPLPAPGAAGDVTSTRVGGTPLYLPPEAFDGAAAGPAFDVWALAVVLFEMVAGAHPFAAGDLEQVRYRIRREPPPDLRKWVPSAPRHLVDLLAATLSVEPTCRPASAAEFARRLAG